MVEYTCTCSVTSWKDRLCPLAYVVCRLHFDLCWLLSADISWQAEDTDLLNTWHSAVLYKFRILPAVWLKRKHQSQNHLSRTGLEQRWIGSRNTGILLPPPPTLSIIGHMSTSVSHGHGGGITGQACCFSPGRQWVSSFLLWSTPTNCCKPQHIT